MGKEPKFTLYSRVDCHLCEQMQVELDKFMLPTAYSVEVVNVDRTAELQKKYGGRIPLLEYNGKILCEYFFDSKPLIETLNLSK